MTLRDLYPFHGAHREYGRTARELDAALVETMGHTIQRKVNGLDIEDQEARTANLSEVRGRLN